MYLPLLRGKQFELLAIRELVAVLNGNQHVTPIIEPVRDNLLSIRKCMDVYEEKKLNLFVITNPIVGYFTDSDKHKDLATGLTMGDYKYVKPAYYLDSNTSKAEINSLVNSYNNKLCFIHLDKVAANNKVEENSIVKIINKRNKEDLHVFFHGLSRNYINEVIGKDFDKAILKDCFPKEDQNKKYPIENSFSDEIFFFKSEGRYGFSDYSMIGSEFSESGGPAVAVAIHIVIEDKKNKELRIKHFVSDRITGFDDPAGKFFEALEKLVDWANNHERQHLNTLSIKEFINLFNKEHYPGLGFVKKLSLFHHMELCNKVISGI
ncbi:MAG: sce7725 family protein [Candidatus Cloacimonetes bacterium]|jgi:hypothetical protein|nr:sce7725 family protein [Candidatus Cloacimonadota bacterium]